MNSERSASSPHGDNNQEIATLIETLHLTEQRLEELTAGEVDTVADRAGRTIMLRRAQDHMRNSEAKRQAAILSALPAHIALLDGKGVIISVNEAWRQFSRANGLRAPADGIGQNYLEICDQASGHDSTEARQVADGIRSVITGAEQSFSIEYPCHSPTEQRWFLMTVTPLADGRSKGAVIMHQNIARQKKAEEQQHAMSRLLDSVIENIPTAVQVKSVKDDFRILMWNKAAEAIYGLPRDAAIGRNVFDLWPAADADRMHAADLALVAKGKAQDFPDRPAQTKTRGEIRVHMRKVALLDADGVPTHVLVIADDITERRRAENAVLQSQRQLRLLMDGLGPSVFVGLMTPQGILLEVNQAPLVATGLRPEDVLGKPFDEAPWWSYSAQVQQQLREAIARAAQGEPFQRELRARGAGESFIDIDFSLQPLGNDAGEVIFLIPSAIVVTDRKRAETALRESETEFRTLAEALPQIVFITTPDGSNTYFSQHWMDYTGLTLEESLGRGWNQVFHPEDHTRVWSAWRHAHAANSGYSLECRLRGADGVYQWWLIRGVPQQDAGGIALKWFGTCTDIHGMKLAQLEITRTNAELQRQKTELQLLLDLVPALILFKDTKNRILRVNRRVAQSAERPVGEIEGQPVAEIFPDIANSSHAQDLEVIHSGIPKLGVVGTLRDPDGIEHWTQTDRVPYRDESGTVIGIVVMVQDITERKRDQDALRELNAELEHRVRTRTTELKLARDEARQANQAKSSFLAAMSHEIRTPMNGVIGMIDVLHQTSLRGDQVEMVDLIRESAESLLAIIDDILDFSKIEAGKLSIESRPLRLETTIEKVCAMLDHMAIRKGVQLSIFVDPALPRTVTGDQNRLRQVLVNLVGNAIKFSGGREHAGQVSVRAMLVDQDALAVTVDLTVEDNGIGMDEATIARLFTPFSQADASTTRRFGGTGLGLAICSMLVNMMKGKLSVQSVLDHGSTFTVRVRFPVADGAGDSDEMLSLIRGLRCRVVGNALPLADDVSAYLAHAGAVVERVPDLAAASSAVQSAGLCLWLILPGLPVPALAALRAMAASRPGTDVRFVVLERGNRRSPRVHAVDLVTIDSELLFRRTLFRTLALASGRMREEVQDDKPGAAPGAEAAPQRHEAALRGRLILVAEDNETNRTVIQKQLTLLGFSAEIAVDGLDALARWRSGDYALLLTDLHMPRMDGYGLTAAIRAEEGQGRRTPILALTANALQDEELRCRAAGMDGYLTKPVRLQQLKEAIDAWLDLAVPPEPSPQVAQPSAVGSAPADLSVLAALVGDDPTVIDEVLQSFRESVTRSSEEMSQGLAIGSMPAVADAAHKMKAAARSIGAMRLGEMCEGIERAAGTESPGELKLLLLHFGRERDAVFRFLESR